jgi:mono/diheme cytochrome c family protein
LGGHFSLLRAMLSKPLLPRLVSAAFFIALSAVAGDKAAPEVDPKLLPPPSSKQDVTYAADIQPIFAKSCHRCHGPNVPKPKGGLRLDTLAAVKKGGEDGPVLVVGNSAKSPMVVMVSHQGDPDDFMPPPKNKAGIPPLTPAQIGLIRAWIDQGAR